MRRTAPKRVGRCGHYELVKTRGKWRCVACGRFFTVPESIQNFIELSDVMKSVIETGRPLSESLDDMLGRQKWDEMLANLPTMKRPHKRGKEVTDHGWMRS